MKRSFTALMAAVLVLALCACGTDAPAETVPPVTPEATASPTPVPTVAVEIPAPEPEDAALVRVRDYIPDIWVDLRYAGENNFTGAAIYDFSDAYLRYGTVKKLAAVQEALRGEGLSLLLWDAYRPQYAQRLLWERCPDANFVANPDTGGSKHSNGGTVDITICTSDGAPMEMPSEFDEFSALADRDYSDVSAEAAANAEKLERLMDAAGFDGYSAEWWHYTDRDGYEIEDMAIG